MLGDDDPLVARVVMTERVHGDLAVDLDVDVVDRRRRAIVDAPWSWLRQEHRSRVFVVADPGDHAGATGDALCTTTVGAPIAVQVADCAPVAFVDPAGVIGVAHAGWRGLVDGVLATTLAEMRRLGASEPVAVLGPCIRPTAYEFGAADLDILVDRFGTGVRSSTATGAPALDLPAAVAAALTIEGIATIDLGGCTAADADRRWSHRARGDRARQAMVVWLDRPDRTV